MHARSPLDTERSLPLDSAPNLSLCVAVGHTLPSLELAFRTAHIAKQLYFFEQVFVFFHVEQDGPRYDYWPTVARETARRSELQHVVRTFFDGSTESALATLLDIQPGELTDETRRRLKRLIDKAAKEGR